MTPPTSARSQSPARSARTAECSATSEDEQAVSTDHDGQAGPRSEVHTLSGREDEHRCSPLVRGAGTPEDVLTRLDALVDELAPDELLITGSTFDVEAQRESDAQLLKAIRSAAPATLASSLGRF